MANPKAWLPYFGETAGRRVAFVGAGLVASLAIHFAIPYSGMFHRVEAVSDSAVIVDFIAPPLPLPPADELDPSMDEEDVDAPKLEDEPVQAPQEESEPAPAPAETPPDAPPDTRAEPAEPPPEALPVEPVPTAAEDAPAATTEKSVDEIQRERDERRRKRLEERRRRFEERRKKRKGSGGKKGGAPDGGEWKTGTPESVYACTATERGEELRVHRERPIYDWMAIVPTVLTGFKSRPDIGDYIDELSQVVQRDRKGLKRLGFGEIALDNDVLQIELDDPGNTRIAVGRLDGRCLVGFKYTAQLFPMTLVRAPIRIVEGTRSSAHLVDFVLYKDVSFEMRSVDGSVLPFNKGRLKNGKAIAQNIEDHYAAAKFAKSLADALGISWGVSASSRSSSTSGSSKKPALAQGKRSRASD